MGDTLIQSLGRRRPIAFPPFQWAPFYLFGLAILHFYPPYPSQSTPSKLAEWSVQARGIEEYSRARDNPGEFYEAAEGQSGLATGKTTRRDRNLPTVLLSGKLAIVITDETLPMESYLMMRWEQSGSFSRTRQPLSVVRCFSNLLWMANAKSVYR